MSPRDCNRIHFEEEHIRRLGLVSTCTRRHEFPHAVPEVDRVWWLLLGRDTKPRSCREWTGGAFRGQAQTSWARVNRKDFHSSIGIERDEPRTNDLVAKVPGFCDPFFVGSRSGFNTMIKEVMNMSFDDVRFWCMSPAPVIIICSEEQFCRFDRQKWFDSVWTEYNFHHPDPNAYLGIFNASEAPAYSNATYDEVRDLQQQSRAFQERVGHLETQYKELQQSTSDALEENMTLRYVLRQVLHGLEEGGVYDPALDMAKTLLLGTGDEPGPKRRRRW